MMSNIRCDFCGSPNYEIVYTPIGTKRENRVCICKLCGLVFSIHNDLPYSKDPTPSGDADWGNVRFCKGQRFDAIKELLPTDAKRILDIGSSRGHFVRWAAMNCPKAEITAIEPDTRVISDYVNDFYVIEKKLEDTVLPPNHYDFIYCMQTLEHTDSASSMLRQIYDCLAPNGTLLLEVPNIEVIGYRHNIEEFFIDKHNFHFSKKVLCSYMEKLGFDVTLDTDDLNVRIWATKSQICAQTNVYIETDSHRLISEYAENIKLNRLKLPRVTNKLLRVMDSQRVAFWGANTLLDLMVKYGELDPSNVKCLIDKYMYGNIEAIHGVKIHPPEVLRTFQPDVCVVLARYSTNEIVKIARKFGVRNIIRFSDLMESA